jgi:hypothetical protein
LESWYYKDKEDHVDNPSVQETELLNSYELAFCSGLLFIVSVWSAESDKSVLERTLSYRGQWGQFLRWSDYQLLEVCEEYNRLNIERDARVMP